MIDTIVCPVCEGRFGSCRELNTPRDARAFACEGCGEFEISRSAFVTWFSHSSRLSVVQRAALSHALRIASVASTTPMVTTTWLEVFLPSARLPTPAVQAANLIRLIGDQVVEIGEPYFVDGTSAPPLIGALDYTLFNQLVGELKSRGQVVSVGQQNVRNPRDVGMISGELLSLTLDGWDLYEKEKKGAVSGRYGFIAMKFGDPVLDPFVEKVVKPAVRDGVTYDLLDLRNVSRAGVIDNIMRAQIRDAAFVLVDLTHDNAGAYWEAGYAEGLGKPVIYICEQSKFDAAKTHFDTNHCTTVMWKADEPAAFAEQLVATIRRSLNLFG